MADYQAKHLHKQTYGWMFPYLITADAAPGIGTGRWAYWEKCILDMALPPEPIPQIRFLQQPHPDAIKNITACIKAGVQQGVRHSQVFELLVTWILYGFGTSQYRLADAPGFSLYQTADQLPGMGRFLNTAKVLDFWYETFNLCLMLQYPADYMAYFSQGAANKDYNPYTGSGFFATPMSVCQLLTDINLSGNRDYRAEMFCDPCAGTGSLLLAVSNHIMRLYAADINQAMVNCLTVNAYLYMPWTVFKPNFSKHGGPTWAQLEEAIFGQPEPFSQPIPVQLPMFEPIRVPEPALATQRAPNDLDTVKALLNATRQIERVIASTPPRPKFDEVAVRKMIRERLERSAGIAA